MTARIYRPAKSAMQSGKGKSQFWVVDFESDSPKHIEPLMGYTSSSDTRSQVRMRFETEEEAIDYAERNGIDYRVIKPHEPRRNTRSYADNFKFDRKVPWTH